MSATLDNIFWHALTGTHAKFAAGSGDARRYAAGFSPIAGFKDAEHPDFAALAPYCEAGEQLYLSGWSGTLPPGWRIEAEGSMLLMVWDRAAPMPEDGGPADAWVQLGVEDAPQALALAQLTRPGPFGLKTIELGEYFGCFEDGKLIAMTGERMQAGKLHEISGVCTDPAFQGRGLARRLLTHLLRRQLQRNETPFLHVMSQNQGARRLYERLGFRNYRESAVRVISKVP